MYRPALIPMPEFMVHLIFGKERGTLLLDGAKIKPNRVEEFGFKYKYPEIRSACKEVGKLFY